MISHSVEISIAGGRGEMVRDPIPWAFFFFYFFYYYYYYYHALFVLGTKSLMQADL